MVICVAVDCGSNSKNSLKSWLKFISNSTRREEKCIEVKIMGRKATNGWKYESMSFVFWRGMFWTTFTGIYMFI